MHDWRESAHLFAKIAAQLAGELQEQDALIDTLREEVFRLTRQLAEIHATAKAAAPDAYYQ